jgi:anti-sigma regulatory factor (Ser/Thr protein kinase)
MRDISLHLMDIIQNSIKAHATEIKVRVATDVEKDELTVEIYDNGMGMDEILLNQVRDPFVTTRTTRKVGLGIPMLEASAERSGGKLDIKSQKSGGTIVVATFKVSNIDRLPLGNIAETIMNIITANSQIDISLKLSNTQKEFNFSVSEIKKHLNGVPIDNIDVLIWIRDYINEGIKTIFGGVLNEIPG